MATAEIQRAQSETDPLACVVCTESMADPVLFPCGHSICSACMNRLRQQSSLNNCVLCRAAVRPGWDFPKNFELANAVAQRHLLLSQMAQLRQNQQRQPPHDLAAQQREAQLAKEVQDLRARNAEMDRSHTREAQDLRKRLADVESTAAASAREIQDMRSRHSELERTAAGQGRDLQELRTRRVELEQALAALAREKSICQEQVKLLNSKCLQYAVRRPLMLVF